MGFASCDPWYFLSQLDIVRPAATRINLEICFFKKLFLTIIFLNYKQLMRKSGMGYTDRHFSSRRQTHAARDRFVFS